MSFLRLKKLSKRFASNQVVSDLSLTVEKGEFVSLLGPSGCGKSTTLQMISGFLQPDSGQVIMDGQDLAGVAANKRGMGIVFQSYALFPHMSVYQNVAFGLEMRKIAAAEQKRRIEDALSLVHLESFADRYPRQLSGGQQQRVGLARALVIEPNLLLLDEPMSSLDAKLREDMHIELKALQRSLGVTTILVTHDQNEAMSLSDRVAVMANGRIVQIDTPSQVYEKPQDAFTSTFLGKNNLIVAEWISASNGTSEIKVGDVLFKATGVSSAHKIVMCSLRPERINIVSPPKGIVQGQIRASHFLGNHWLLAVDTPIGLLLVFKQNTGVAQPREGATVGLDWAPEDARLLEGQA